MLKFLLLRIKDEMIHEIKNNLFTASIGFLSGVGLILFKIWIEKKPRVIAYFTSTGLFTIKNKDTNFETVVCTHVLVVRNEGGKPAKNININHSHFDSKICILPHLDYNLKDTAQGGKAIILPMLPPKNEVMITYLYDNQIPVVHGPIFHEEGNAKVVKTIAIPEISKFAYYLRIFLIGVGVVICVAILSNIFLKLL